MGFVLLLALAFGTALAHLVGGAETDLPGHALFGPAFLVVGYISLDLKRQLRRRGYPSADRRATFSDLVAHDPKPAGDDRNDPSAGSRRRPPSE